MTSPVEGSSPTPDPSKHPKLAGKAQEAKSEDKYAFLLKSPFAKMFERSGATPTGEQIHAIMNGIMMNTFYELKRQEAHRKEVDKHLKDVIEGKDDP